jgi:hypothetical protein
LYKVSISAGQKIEAKIASSAAASIGLFHGFPQVKWLSDLARRKRPWNTTKVVGL